MENKEHPVDRELFLELLNKRFPKVYADIDEIDSGLLHLEMAVFSHATSRAIEEMSWREVSKHFDFISDIFSRGTPEIQNAVTVSYLENVFIGEGSPRISKARSMLPHALSISLVELENHFEMLSNMQNKS